MRIKHYDHIKSQDKKKEALYRALGSNTPFKAGVPIDYGDEISSLYNEEPEDNNEQEKDNSFIDVDMLNEELLNGKNKNEPATKEEQHNSDVLENPSETIKRIEAEKRAIQKKLEENALHMTNERLADLEGKFENVMSKLKSDSLILLNSLDMGAFKKEISYYMVEFAQKDEGFKTKVHDLFDAIGEHENAGTKKAIKKTKEKKKAKKERSKILDIAMISIAGMVSLAGVLYYLTGGKILQSNKSSQLSKVVEVKTEKVIEELPKKNVSKAKDNGATNDKENDVIVTVAPKKEVNFLVETKSRFSIRCTNGYRKKFYHKKRLKGYLEDGRFYFKTKQDNTSLYCSTDELSIEKIF